MLTFISLLTFTDKDTTEIRNSVEQTRELKRIAKEKGIDNTETYWINGSFDMIHIFRVNNEKEAILYTLHLTAEGNFKTQTYRAYNRDETREILKQVFNPYDLLKSELEDYSTI